MDIAESVGFSGYQSEVYQLDPPIMNPLFYKIPDLSTFFQTGTVYGIGERISTLGNLAVIRAPVALQGYSLHQ